MHFWNCVVGVSLLNMELHGKRYEQIRYIGPRHFLLSVQIVGQVNNPFPDEGLITAVGNLSKNGFSDSEIRLITAENTTFLAEG